MTIEEYWEKIYKENIKETDEKKLKDAKVLFYLGVGSAFDFFFSLATKDPDKQIEAGRQELVDFFKELEQ